MKAEKIGLDDFVVWCIETGKDAPKELQTVIDNAVEAPPELDWQQLYMRSSSGAPVANGSNVGIALENAPELIDCFKYDDMGETSMLVAPLPGMSEEKLPRPVSDQDTILVQRWLQREGDLRNIGKEPVRDAIELRAEQCHYHGIRDRLESLVWDRKPRLKGWLKTYLGATNNPEYLEVVGPMIPIAMVARVYEPGCQQDLVPMLDGPQGIGKTRLLERLAGDPRYYSDSMPEISQDEVRTSSHIRGHWVIELAELSALRKADQETIKNFLSRKTDKFIPKYGHKEIDRPRQCMFWGTTNKKDYLKDPTGARRYAPIACTIINLDRLTEDLDQLFAEAVVLYKAGAARYPDEATEQRLFRPEQEARFAGIHYQETIAEWLAPYLDEWVLMDEKGLNLRYKDTEAARTRITNSSIGMLALGFTSAGAINKTQHGDITLSMERLGWKLGRYSGLPRWQPTLPVIEARAQALIAAAQAKADEAAQARKKARQKPGEVVRLGKGERSRGVAAKAGGGSPRLPKEA